MNPVAWFVPGVRANGATFFAGLIALLALDAVRTAVFMYGGFDAPPFAALGSFLLIVLFLVFLHVNRLNDAGRSWAWLLLPILLAVVAFFLVAIVFGMIIFFDQLGVYAEANGMDAGTIMQDPALMQEFQTYFEDNVDEISGIGSYVPWIGFGAFWAVIVLFGLWFRGMPSREA